MSSRPFKAFVSSTFEDLKDHRAYVIRYLRKAGIFVDPMEDWTAESDEPKQFSRDRLEGCDFCVLLVALRRGYVPKGETASITQLEYHAALDAGIDVLVYLLDENCPWPHRFVELDKDPGISEWRRGLGERHGRGLFGLDSSTIEIAPAVTRWVEKQSRKATRVGDDWIQLVSNLLDLPRNEPKTWKVAGELLPHALKRCGRPIRPHWEYRPNTRATFRRRWRWHNQSRPSSRAHASTWKSRERSLNEHVSSSCRLAGSKWRMDDSLILKRSTGRSSDRRFKRQAWTLCASIRTRSSGPRPSRPTGILNTRAWCWPTSRRSAPTSFMSSASDIMPANQARWSYERCMAEPIRSTFLL